MIQLIVAYISHSNRVSYLHAHEKNTMSWFIINLLSLELAIYLANDCHGRFKALWGS